MTVKEQMCAFKGTVFALIAGLSSTVSGCFVKLTHDIHSLEILIFRWVALEIFSFLCRCFNR